jgi:RimJ/RimL family protein N-acetyltransferase
LKVNRYSEASSFLEAMEPWLSTAETENDVSLSIARYDVTPSHWGKGIATAVCRAATLWGFDVRGWHRNQGTVVLANFASQRVLERCGFQREGLLRNFRLVGGQSTDYRLYSAIPGELRSAT